MTSPYLTQPLRTLEQVIAEKLKRPVPVGNIATATKVAASPSEETPRPRMVVVRTAAEGGDD